MEKNAAPRDKRNIMQGKQTFAQVRISNGTILFRREPSEELWEPYLFCQDLCDPMVDGMVLSKTVAIQGKRRFQSPAEAVEMFRL